MKIQKRLIRYWEEHNINAGVEEGIDAFTRAYENGAREPRAMMEAWKAKRAAQKQETLQRQVEPPKTATNDTGEV
jgi:hypothetical protein